MGVTSPISIFDTTFSETASYYNKSKIFNEQCNPFKVGLWPDPSVKIHIVGSIDATSAMSALWKALSNETDFNKILQFLKKFK